jgi:hypothetical protein
VSNLRTLLVVALTVVALALLLAACGGGDDEEAAPSPAPAETPGQGAPPPGAGGLQLPPGIAECLADQGFDVDPSQLHSVPQQVLSECFNALHQGGGAP